MMENIHYLSDRLVSSPVPSVSTGFLLWNANTTDAAKAVRCPSAFGRCHCRSVRGGFGAAGPGSPLLDPWRRAAMRVPAAGWLSGFGAKKEKGVPRDIVKTGDPVLHEPADEVPLEEIGSEKVQKIIDDMIVAMRKAPGVGLAASQIGVPLKIIVLEDRKEYISYAPKADIKAQDRHPFDLLVIVNPKLKSKGNKSALFFEGCLSVDGFRAVVERYLEVEVSGLDRNGLPIKIDATGWQARILQHECDHLDGTLYVDKMVPRTFRTVENLDLPLATGCPPLGVRQLSSLCEKKINVRHDWKVSIATYCQGSESQLHLEVPARKLGPVRKSLVLAATRTSASAFVPLV